MESLSSVGGALAGSLDRAYYLMRFAKNRPRFFSDGWGDVEEQKKIQANLIERLSTPECCKESRKLASLRWDDHPRVGTSGAVICRAIFESPQSDALPEASKMARFYFVSPANSVQPWKSLSSSASPSSSDGGDSPKGIVLLLPSTGEQGSEGRLQLAERLAEENGFCSLVLTAPLYGARKPAEQQMHYARTVALYLLQSSTIIEEAALLLCWCADRWPGVPLCVSGFSWGGAMTCVSAILASQWARGAEVLAVPYAGSATPAVIVDGLLQDDVDWPALAAKDGNEPFESTRARLLKLLLQTHLSEIVKPICDGNAKGRPQLAGLRAVSFENDYFVVRAYGEELFDIASSCCAPGAAKTLVWKGGGHVCAFLRRMRVQKEAIQEAFRALRGGSGDEN